MKASVVVKTEAKNDYDDWEIQFQQRYTGGEQNGPSVVPTSARGLMRPMWRNNTGQKMNTQRIKWKQSLNKRMITKRK